MILDELTHYPYKPYMAEKISDIPKGLKVKLTDKQRAFCRWYVILNNATAAARKAGYVGNHRQVGSEVLNNPKVKDYISRLRDDQANRLSIHAEQVVLELAAIAFSDITDVVEWDANGINPVASADLDSIDSKAIAEVSHFRNIKGITNVKVKTHDKLKALDQLAKHLGMYKDPSGKDPVSPVQIFQTFMSGNNGNENEWTEQDDVETQKRYEILYGQNGTGRKKRF